MYAYTSGSCSGSPHSSHSVTVSGSDGSRIVVSASTNGTCATIPAKVSGAMLATAPISRPPAEQRQHRDGETGVPGDLVAAVAIEQARRRTVPRRALAADQRDRHPGAVVGHRPLAVLLVVLRPVRGAVRRR